VAIRDLPGLELAGVYTHFANADLADPELTQVQIDRFDQVRQKLKEAGLDEGIFHLANSAAILVSKLSDGNGVRPGLMLYGSSPSEHTETLSRADPAALPPYQQDTLMDICDPSQTAQMYSYRDKELPL
jgi:alanine racemase